jgi:hypothetical protein
MSKFRATTAAVLTAAFLAAGALVPAAAAPEFAGIVVVSSTEFGRIVGGGEGTGGVVFKGQNHAFKLKGLRVAAKRNLADMNATGEVYDLQDLAQFPGTYTRLDAGSGPSGAAAGLYLRSDKGVILRLEPRDRDLPLDVGADGVTVTLVERPKAE